jgi:hypothetical protein
LGVGDISGDGVSLKSREEASSGERNGVVVMGVMVGSEWHGFPYLPGFGQRVCRVRGKGMFLRPSLNPYL